MYEMYPDTWHVAEDGHHDTAGKPRRRARKEQPVVRALLVPQSLVPQAAAPRPRTGA